MNQWMGPCRWTYNQVVAGPRQAGKLDLSKKTLRAQYVNKANFADTDKTWVPFTPYDLRDEAMLDVIKVCESNFAKRAENQQHKFYIRFKRKKQV